MKRLTDVVRRTVTNNPLFKLLSLAVAVILWAWLQSEQIVEESAWVKVHYELPDKLVMAQNPTGRLRVTVKGPQRYVKHLRRSNMELTVDLSDAAMGVQQVDFVDSDIAGMDPTGVDIVGLVPNSVQVDLEEKHSRAVRVAATLVGETATGYRVASIEVAPDEVVVEGPKSVVERLGRVATAPVDVGGLAESSSFQVLVALKPRSLKLATPSLIEVRVTVEALTSERTFTDVPVIVRNRAWVAELDTVVVTLSGPVSSLQAVDLETVAVMVRVAPDVLLESIEADRDGSDGARYTVVHSGGPDVELVQVDPGTLRVAPRVPDKPEP